MFNKKSETYSIQNHILKLETADLLAAPVDVIVNPVNAGLPQSKLTQQIMNSAGELASNQYHAFISANGPLEVTQVISTSAGKLPHKAIIHAVGPHLGEGNEQFKIRIAILNCLKLCENNGWQSIAFPPVSTGLFGVPVETCAQAFAQAIPDYWASRQQSIIEQIQICLSAEHFDLFNALIKEKLDINKSIFENRFHQVGDFEAAEMQEAENKTGSGTNRISWLKF